MKHNQQKAIEEGVKLYDKFCSNLSPILQLMTPSTYTLELFYLLNKQKEQEILFREMIKELLKNFQEDEIVLKNGELYWKINRLKKLTPPPQS